MRVSLINAGKFVPLFLAGTIPFYDKLRRDKKKLHSLLDLDVEVLRSTEFLQVVILAFFVSAVVCLVSSGVLRLVVKVLKLSETEKYLTSGFITIISELMINKFDTLWFVVFALVVLSIEFEAIEKYWNSDAGGNAGVDIGENVGVGIGGDAGLSLNTRIRLLHLAPSVGTKFSNPLSQKLLNIFFKIEPPILAINTVLSVMAYNYLPEKLSVYLSDDGGSDLTFYTLLKASVFFKQWIPFCKKFNIEPRSPAAYFSTTESKCASLDTVLSRESAALKKLYKAMEDQIETATKFGHIPEDIQTKHTGFSEWASVTSQRDHQSILQIIIDGRDSNAVDADGCVLPTLVYLSCEKRPNRPHNFKAGAMNALVRIFDFLYLQFQSATNNELHVMQLRVSSKISNGQIILNVDSDMYSNNLDVVKDVLRFFMDEQKGNEIAYVLFPQNFNNLTKNDIYGSKMDVITKVEFPGCDGHGGILYIGTGCFHRRESLCGKKYETGYKFDMKRRIEGKVKEGVNELEETSKILANCTYEEGTQWGKDVVEIICKENL
ncbi:hypothetical protein GIB67_036186 [Kingdonia uniflora]|uniref:Uncharacterized protein n=1 Tax=Kingdonia uniflora TaxID=39325 RepID=A0A7J7N9A8_9MAGN|nr:hypothetical protein GIB67_036186 [Kingdonia uniflora]